MFGAELFPKTQTYTEHNRFNIGRTQGVSINSYHIHIRTLHTNTNSWKIRNDSRDWLWWCDDEEMSNSQERMPKFMYSFVFILKENAQAFCHSRYLLLLLQHALPLSLTIYWSARWKCASVEAMRLCVRLHIVAHIHSRTHAWHDMVLPSWRGIRPTQPSRELEIWDSQNVQRLPSQQQSTQKCWKPFAFILILFLDRIGWGTRSVKRSFLLVFIFCSEKELMSLSRSLSPSHICNTFGWNCCRSILKCHCSRGSVRIVDAPSQSQASTATAGASQHRPSTKPWNFHMKSFQFSLETVCASVFHWMKLYEPEKSNGDDRATITGIQRETASKNAKTRDRKKHKTKKKLKEDETSAAYRNKKKKRMKKNIKKIMEELHACRKERAEWVRTSGW